MPGECGRPMRHDRRKGSVVVYVLIILLAAFLVSLLFMLTREDPEEIYRKNSNIRVEVLNGCGVNRLAMKVTNILRKQGFNVIKIGNTEDQDFEKTVIVERSEETLTHAKYMSERIGCKNIGKDIDPGLYLEVTVIIGKDYEEIFPDVKKEF
jgi:hypothetical protein